VKRKLDSISNNTRIENVIDIDMNPWQIYRNYPNGNVNLLY